MTASSSALSPSPAAGDPNAMQVFQNALAGQPANDGPVTGSQIDGVMDPDPSVDGSMTAPDMQDPANDDYPLAIQGLLGSGVYAQPYTDALSKLSLSTAPSQPDADPSVDGAMTAPDMRDPETGNYPLAIQGLLGGGVSAQPYSDALSQLSLDTMPSQPDPDPSVGGGMTAPDMSDPATGDYPLAIQGLLGSGVYAQPYSDALSQLSLNATPPPADLYTVRPGDTLWSITHGDYAKMAAIAERNGLKLAADGSPVVRPGDLLLIPDISGLGPAAYLHKVHSGRNMVAANTQGIAQKRAAQAAAQNASLRLLDRIHPPQETVWNTWGAPDFSSGRLFTPPVGGNPWASRNPAADLQPERPGRNYYIDSHGQGYFLSEGPDGSEIKPDNRKDIYWQQKLAELGRAEGYGPDGQPGTGVFGSIFYTYPKLLGASGDEANLWGSLGSAADGLGAGVSGVGPYRPETPSGLGSYETPYESPSLKTDITYPTQPPVQTIYTSRATAAAPRVGQLTAEQIASPYFVRIDPLTGKGPMAIDTTGFSNDTTLKGGARNGPQFWKRWANAYPDTLSNANALKIKNRRAPIVDDVWTQSFPEHSDFMDETIEHHHLDYGPNAIPLPEPVHRSQPGWGIWHPDHAGG